MAKEGAEGCARMTKKGGGRHRLTQEECRRGGVSSGKVRRRQRAFRESVRAILACEVPDEELRDKLGKLGLDTTVLNAIHAAVFEKAVRGDVTAARYLRDMAEESEQERMERTPPEGFLELSGLTDDELRQIAFAEEARGPRESPAQAGLVGRGGAAE